MTEQPTTPEPSDGMTVGEDIPDETQEAKLKASMPGWMPDDEYVTTTEISDDDITADDETGSEDDENDKEDEERGKPNEAAKYRRRLRETEAERDTLRTTVERLQRAEAERLAANDLAVPADLFELGQASLADLLDAEGHVVPELVHTAVYGLVEQRPGLAAPKPARGPSAAGAGIRGTAGGGPSWSDVLRGS